MYDLHESNEYLYAWGFGSYHSGVEVGGSEYTFGGGSGIFSHSPKDVPNAKLRESILIGEILASRTVEGSISELRSQFEGSSYNLLMKNCNHFSDSLVFRLTGNNIPGYVNRMATIGGYFSCLLPPSMLGEAPVNDNRSSIDRRSTGASSAPTNFAQSKGFKLGGKRHREYVRMFVLL